jgi:small subunit ribosomal protein S20
MPNIKSAKKRVKVSTKETLRNKMVRSNMKTLIKKAEKAVAENSAEKDVIVKAAVKAVDKASAKGVIHKNNAARKKSQIAKKLNATA